MWHIFNDEREKTFRVLGLGLGSAFRVKKRRRARTNRYGRGKKRTPRLDLQRVVSPLPRCCAPPAPDTPPCTAAADPRHAAARRHPCGFPSPETHDAGATPSPNSSPPSSYASTALQPANSLLREPWNWSAMLSRCSPSSRRRLLLRARLLSADIAGNWRHHQIPRLKVPKYQEQELQDQNKKPGKNIMSV
ncbi:uncharacterized protein [Triticum aestivum]|uniref:uncharacterized protein n=1 Tax=Triticum aestivum TaxID=4565 RepID=UPI001D00C592|nr:uncharacterized protein LOC123101395 [Triticum aestivum]